MTQSSAVLPPSSGELKNLPAIETAAVAITGLAEEEVLARRRQGQGNDVELSTSRTFKEIILTNVFHPVNLVLYAIGLGLFLVGDRASGFTTLGIVLFNAVVGMIQETRAKRKLDEIALMARAKATVYRAGQEKEVDPSELVLGDILRIRAGDQIPVDGEIAGEGNIEVDESA